MLLLGAGLRLYHLGSVPTELNYDEIDLYNSARSIATTGHDLDGTLLPFLWSHWTRNPPLYAVLAYLSSLVFGPTAFALRLPAALFGIVAIALVFALTRQLTGRRDVALVAALALATGPIFVHFSRLGWEPAAQLPFLLGGLVLLLWTLDAPRDDAAARGRANVALYAAAVLLALGSYAYPDTWLYVVLLAGTLLLLRSDRIVRAGPAHVAGAGALWFALSAPAFWMLLYDPMTSAKVHRLALFVHGISARGLATFGRNYVEYFSPQFLAGDGAPFSGLTWRYLDGFGALTIAGAVLAAAGTLAAGKYARARPLAMWLWIWLALYPLGGALTSEGPPAPNAARVLAGAPILAILAGVGYAAIAGWLGRIRPAYRDLLRAGTFATAMLVCLVQGAQFATFYFTEYVHRNSNAWDSGTAHLFAVLRKYAPDYDRVCFSVRQGWYEVGSYSRFYLQGLSLTIVRDANQEECFARGTLVASDGGAPLYRYGFEPLALIRDVDGEPFATISSRPNDPLGRNGLLLP